MADPFATPVRDYMTTNLVSVRVDTQLDYVLHLLEHRGISCVLVSDGEGAPAGVVSTTDLLLAAKFDAVAGRAPTTILPTGIAAGDIMQRDLVTVDEGDTIRRAAEAMIQNHIHRVFVRRQGLVVGVLSTRDVMRLVLAQHVSTPLSEVMTSPVTTVDLGDSIDDALAKLDASNVRGLVVCDGRWPVGVFTHTEAIRARALPRELRRSPVEDGHELRDALPRRRHAPLPRRRPVDRDAGAAHPRRRQARPPRYRDRVRCGARRHDALRRLTPGTAREPSKGPCG
jgi:CBS domain-containing protein